MIVKKRVMRPPLFMAFRKHTIPKTKAENIAVSTICPHNIVVKTQALIEALNAVLQDFCAIEGSMHIDRRGSFTLGVGSISDSFILSGVANLNWYGTNILATNIWLKIKGNVNDITKPWKNYKPRPKSGHPDRPPHDLDIYETPTLVAKWAQPGDQVNLWYPGQGLSASMDTRLPAIERDPLHEKSSWRKQQPTLHLCLFLLW